MIRRRIRRTAAGCGTSTPCDELVPEGMELDDQSCIVLLVANYMLLHIITCSGFLHASVNACNYMSLHVIS